jgi:hypothetical protein
VIKVSFVSAKDTFVTTNEAFVASSDAFCMINVSLFIPKASFATQKAAFFLSNATLVLQKASLIVDGASSVVQNDAFVVEDDAFIGQNDAFVIQNDAFVDTNEAFYIHKASFGVHGEVFALLEASWVKEKSDLRSAGGVARETGVALGPIAAAFVGRPSVWRPSPWARTKRAERSGMPAPMARSRKPLAALRRDSKRMGSLVDPLLDVVRALTCTELDDAKIGEAALVKRIFQDDRFDLFPALADRQDDPAVSGYLSARNQKMARGVVLLQEGDVRGHMPVNLGECCFVGELDDEHVSIPRMTARAAGARADTSAALSAVPDRAVCVLEALQVDRGRRRRHALGEDELLRTRFGGLPLDVAPPGLRRGGTSAVLSERSREELRQLAYREVLGIGQARRVAPGRMLRGREARDDVGVRFREAQGVVADGSDFG